MNDKEMVRDVLGTMLKRLGCDVAFARDGAEVVGIYEEHGLVGIVTKPFNLAQLREVCHAARQNPSVELC